ncbi:MAG: TRAP transporter small permease [Pseudomonadota bacterium]
MPENKTTDGFLNRASTWINLVEDGLLVGLLLLMIGLAVGQIVFRNILDGGFVWGDALVRQLVLWLCLIGAMIGSRQGKHINIDVVTRYLPGRARTACTAVVEFCAAIVCGVVLYHSLRFIKLEYADGFIAFGKVPTWVCESIIPLGFAVIGLRYLVLSLKNLNRTFRPSL